MDDVVRDITDGVEMKPDRNTSAHPARTATVILLLITLAQVIADLATGVPT